LNYLAHFLLAAPSNDDDFLIGSLLPDIARRANVQISSNRLKEVQGQLYSGLKSGIELHWMADKKFHQSNLFNLGVALWKVHLEKRFPGVERKFFLFHLLFEMWLDRLLLARKPESGTDMYDTLALADPETLGLFSSHHLGDRSQQLVQTFQGFVKRKFILEYEHEASFSRISTEVFAYVTQQPWQEKWQQPVIDTLEELQKFETDVLYIWDVFEADLMSDWNNRAS
jgi:hypothetical protein